MPLLSSTTGNSSSTLSHRLLALFALAAAVAPGASAETVTWTQTGSSGNGSWNVPYESMTDNMNWLVGANWGGDAVPGTSSQIVFGNVTSDLNTNAGIAVNGRAVGLVDADFFGDATSSLTLIQTTAGFKNLVAVRHSVDTNSPTNLTFQIGQVDISAGSEFRYQGYATANSDTVRTATLGYGSNTVTNDGIMLFAFSGTNNNRTITGGLSIAVGSTFTNNGTFTLNASASNNSVQGGTRLNALIGDTVNTGSMTINRSGDSTGMSNIAFDAAQGGIEFASFRNMGDSSSFTMTVNNGTTLNPNVTPPVPNRTANLVIAGALRNEGTFTLNRTPLSSALDTASRTFTVQAGSLANDASGVFAINHGNSATPLTTTSSLVELAISGAAVNDGQLSLSGKGTTVSAGNIVTRLVTAGGFTNGSGGIVTVSGDAFIQNTGDFVNLNTAASRVIQGASREWDTRGLVVSTTSTGAGSQLEWATGIVVDTSILSTATFDAAHFTLGGLQVNGSYTLSGGGDLLIAGDFGLSGTLNLGDWSSITSDGGKGQTLLFANGALSDSISSLIESGAITASLANGFQLAVIPGSIDEAFYIGVVAIPEPSGTTLVTLAVMGGLAMAFRRKAAPQEAASR